MSNKIDIFPTHEFCGYKVRYGLYLPCGATKVEGGVNFSIYSYYADFCALVLFQIGAENPFIEIPFRGLFLNLHSNCFSWVDFRIGNLFTLTVFDLIYDEIEYGFRFLADLPSGKYGQPAIHRFAPSKIILDPYAKAVGGRDVWGANPENPHPLQRARVIAEDYDWDQDRQLELPMEEMIIYEMHVRGFTRHPSSNVSYPGTFHAIIEKIPYLKKLGINCIELMPIAEFDEFEMCRKDPITNEPLVNFWGYNPLAFFAPKAGYAALGKFQDGTLVADELKTLVKMLHKNGIEIILDVVLNHSSEGNEYGPTLSFKGIDNAIYYLLTPDGWYYNFSGTGNTLNCNHPIVRNFLLDCLRYWVAEYHIDGFRFDLASILGRDSSGAPMANPPLLEALSYDPILAKCKLIAEAWDAGGLYQVGSFPAYGRWAEWNGKYRDVVRKFVKGDGGQLSAIAQCLQGSPQLYRDYHKCASINFITCHDGFTLTDLVSYNHKHNEHNGENNRDGSDENHSWNCGSEGETQNAEINALRLTQIKNFIAILMLSRGVPMIYMGDEMGRTQKGNNNAYCHDNPENWLDWELWHKNQETFHFMKQCIAFRKNNSNLIHDGNFTWYADWNEHSRSMAYMLQPADSNCSFSNRCIFVSLNMNWHQWLCPLPHLKNGEYWHLFANTGKSPPKDIADIGKEMRLENQLHLLLEPRTMCILTAIPADNETHQ